MRFTGKLAAADAAELGKATRLDDGVVVEVESEETAPPDTAPEVIDPFEKQQRLEAEKAAQSAAEQPARTAQRESLM